MIVLLFVFLAYYPHTPTLCDVCNGTNLFNENLNGQYTIKKNPLQDILYDVQILRLIREWCMQNYEHMNSNSSIKACLKKKLNNKKKTVDNMCNTRSTNIENNAVSERAP